VRGVEEETSAWSSRRSCHARNARNAPRTTCIATATPANAIPSFSPKLSRRRLGGGDGGGGRWRLCRCRRGCRVGGADGRGGAAGTAADLASRSGAGTDDGGEGAAAQESDGEERRSSGRRRVSVAARSGGAWRGRGAMGGEAA
jgi:hypothetical protein